MADPNPGVHAWIAIAKALKGDATAEEPPTLPAPDTDGLDGCARACRTRGAHTRVWGDCAYGIEPEPTVTMGKTYVAEDGYPAIGYDQYTVQELADLIEPALRNVTVGLRPDTLVMLQRGQTVGLSLSEYADLAREAAHAIVHRNDQKT